MDHPPAPASPLNLSTAARAQLAMSHLGTVVGWFVLLVASLFFWGFVMQSELVTALEFETGVARTEGTIQRIAVHGRRGPDVHVDFTYEVGGQRYEARSYAPNEGAVVREPVVEYVVDEPWRARIEGLDARPIRGGLFFLVGVIAAVAVGLVCTGAGALAGAKNRRFFRRARLATGRVVGQDASGAQSRVVSVALEYGDSGRAGASPGPPWRTRVVLRREVAAALRDPLPILYDPEEPERAMLLEHLECGVRYRADRGIVAGRGWLVAGVVAPLAFLVANVVMGASYLS